ncbi:hypothetical protein [Paenibacillus xylanexedens]|uniref:hypothetical protein n=1 Tax=Paenibacillus xylanexedens TaxID=528191 RepID=UPI00119ECB4B|nr:hypothetical protein [Paenibacillus xylanexedens]
MISAKLEEGRAELGEAILDPKLKLAVDEDSQIGIEQTRIAADLYVNDSSIKINCNRAIDRLQFLYANGNILLVLE